MVCVIVTTMRVSFFHRWAAIIGLCGAATVICPLAPAEACLWDNDTLAEESLGQPEVVAAVTGDLGKHSLAFFTAKVAYTEKLIASGNPKIATAARYDDLAVAQARLGQLDQALATLDAKDKLFPNMYTTASNRGTFYMLQGNFADAKTWLDTALKMDPNAHFGREKYQMMLLQYLQRLASDPKLATTENFLGIAMADLDNPETALMPLITKQAKKQRGMQRRPAPSEVVIALTGITRFGEGQDNPHLWFALGWALVQQGDAHLASRAFRRAQLLQHPTAEQSGTMVVSAIAGARFGCCRLSPALTKQWQKFSKKADAQWQAGQVAQAKRQAAEDALIKNGRLAKAFGY
jgi:tetratricopeptide (TPR) repeat protein